MFSKIRPNCGSQKHASFFHMTNSKQTDDDRAVKLLKVSFTSDRQPNSPEHEDCSDDRAIKLGCSD